VPESCGRRGRSRRVASPGIIVRSSAVACLPVAFLVRAVLCARADLEAVAFETLATTDAADAAGCPRGVEVAEGTGGVASGGVAEDAGAVSFEAGAAMTRDGVTTGAGVIAGGGDVTFGVAGRDGGVSSAGGCSTGGGWVTGD
jgi:hypothetical protein